MSREQLRIELQGLFERRDRSAVIVILQIRLAQAYKAGRNRRLEFGDFTKFGNGQLELPVLLGLGSGLHVLHGLWRRALCCQEKNEESTNHGRSGSRISRTWSA